MNEKQITPWPHSPGVIVAVGDNYHEVRIFGKIYHRISYEDAVAVCEQQKRIAAWHEELLAPPMFPDYALADEMAV